MFKKSFYYGDGSENVVKLTQIQADSVNNLRTHESSNDDGLIEISFEGRGNVRSYNEAADILTAYASSHTVTWNDTDKPMLREVN